MPALRLGEIVGLLERRYPPALAESWDAVGLALGDPDQSVRRVLLAVDPVAVTAQEAIDWGADLLLTHHPLFLTAVHSVAATTGKGRLAHDLVRAGCALYSAHTNADAVPGGVADCLARAVGLRGSRPLVPSGGDPLDLLVTYVPVADAEELIRALSVAGAGSVGAYEQCAWTVDGRGQFLPGAGARPAIGTVGEVTRVSETRVEMVVPRPRRFAVISALKAAHPYEEPAFSLLEMVPEARGTGTGRIGDLDAPVTLHALARTIADTIPATARGVLVSGDLDALVRTVAVCGGSGSSLVRAARASGADVLVTADHKHHPASEARDDDAGGPPYLVDLAHWASEWPWLPQAAADLRSAVEAMGATIQTRVSTIVTDPWSARFDPAHGGGRQAARLPHFTEENP